ncbi:hypothetical protein [Mycobacterium asiaticum]|uniref:Uncharacterized protein n=1 Tax=Mycobacterium asiaticum TaxID=1790 RepID=A0A1A3NQU0_MYCAS|nr:hypothetical protein [Mycobacterium asiaticum]OBK22677.1 hypothetical protein A5635_21225 [Mycobacterium asiaticum]OBK93304.1 hypothetical protein A5645_20430 [Mycobacterium asiaticum]
MKLKLAIRELHRSERRLARGLNGISVRHRSDQDISHLARDLSGWSQSHLGVLAKHGRNYGVRLATTPRTAPRASAVQSWLGSSLRHRPQPGLLLLAELRHVHRLAAGVSLDWELLSQAAQAAKDQELVELTSRCHPETLRQMRWANAMLKELSPQILTS